MGHSRPKWGVRTMSGLPPLATIERTYEEVRFVPVAEMVKSAQEEPRSHRTSLGSAGELRR
jgi:hypothetical protein